MAFLAPFLNTDKTAHNSHKFAFKLSPTNYGYWRSMIQPFLITNHLFGYIDGTIPCPSETVISTAVNDKEPAPPPQPNPNYPTWIANDAHVRMLLMSSISEGSFQHVQGTTSRDLWLSLERAYAPHSSSREYTLKTQLLKIEMRSDETSSAYLTRAREYADALANIGEPMKDKDVVMCVISGLREEYNGLKATLLARQFPTAFIELHGLLSDHDYMIRKSVPEPATLKTLQHLAAQLGFSLQPSTSFTKPSTSQAFYTTRSGNSRGRSTNRGRGNSHNNRFQGGGNRNQFSWASNQNTVYGTCNRCGIGHVPSQCPNRDPATLRRQQPSANLAALRSQLSSSWLPDTGSTNHVTPDLSTFDNTEFYTGADNLHVGDGKGLPILHIGSKTFHSPSKTFSLNKILHVPKIKQNLLSVQQFCLDNNVFFEFHSTFFAVKDKFSRTTLLTGPTTDGLYSFQLPQVQPIPKVAFSTARASSSTWHQRLGHPHQQLLRSMLSHYSLPVSNNSGSGSATGSGRRQRISSNYQAAVAIGKRQTAAATVNY
ncbi:hypothetical protein E3N88_10732 [Mikania micrantha]|uniref:Uncharacterized protein n=1 Tax=Mikania micrantha TaxID=192012 RepID=A0A5N6PBC3_9ASTR|nr:hypothetical protein E3N88_10732 [Mikania micrantha]